MAGQWARSADSMDGVVQALDTVTSRARAGQSALGYFAALYGTVTRTVAHGVDTEFFDDGPRMEQFVVAFANRYLTALEGFQSGGEATRCWGVAFNAAGDATPIVLQHLLLGINAHINLDLGIAAAQVAPGNALPGLRRDFERVNEILALMTGRAQQALAQISPWLGLLDVVGGRADDEVVRFSIEVARHEAWRFAVELAGSPPADHAGPIAARDRFVARLGRRVRHPGALTTALWLLRLRESKDVRTNLDVLTAVHGPDLAEVAARVEDRRATG